MMNIYLVGFMGTGKTSVGLQLAKDRHLNFVDLDDLIELKEQRRIVDIFAKEGEPYFRKIEKKAFLALHSDAAQRQKNVLPLEITGRLLLSSAALDLYANRSTESYCTGLFDFHTYLLNPFL